MGKSGLANIFAFGVLLLTTQVPQAQERRFPVFYLDSMPEERARFLLTRPSPTAAEARSFMAGRTRLSLSPGHSTQVSYATADGTIFLWYPENAAILRGAWRVQERNIPVMREGRTVRTLADAQVCFNYGSNSVDGVTGERRAGFNCVPLTLLQKTLVEAKLGDVFNLSKRPQVPFLLTRNPTTMAALLSRAASR